MRWLGENIIIVLLLIVILFFSGCVELAENNTDKINVGWNNSKYDDYSNFYKYLINNTRSDMYHMRTTHMQELVFEIDDKLMEMPSDKNEIEKTWYLALSNHQHGLEALVKAYGTDCSSGAIGGVPNYGEKYPGENIHRENCRQNYLAWSKQAQIYFDKSYEYRQNIEEWNPITPRGKEVILNDGQQKFSTIQAAINAASFGDVISVNNNIYSENIIINKNGISIIGINKENVILEGGYIRIEHANNVTVSGFTIKNFVDDRGGKGNIGISSSKGNVGIYLSYADNNTITNVIIANKPIGIGLISSRYNKISDNEIKSSSRYGIQFTYSIDNIIHNNIIQENKVGIGGISKDKNKILSNNFIKNEENGVLIVSTHEPNYTINSIGMEFIEITAGEFSMGKPPDKKDSDYNADGPPHIVKILKPFYIGKYEVTQNQWREIMGNNPSSFKGDNLPVENVSWTDAQNFIEKLNEKERVDEYRLPSEAEWEWAGQGIKNLDESAWYNKNSNDKTHQVGEKKSNTKGLYDTSGNVWEWVQDSWHKGYYGAPTDGSIWEGNNSLRVIRGCSWNNFVERCQLTKRGFENLKIRTNYIGFRIVKEI